ncbi:RHS repeat protein [Pectobacterium carotovorum]|nr:RHS repeat domain-containing protein [Pectobacterium carotovorum]UCZ81792.1 RHS repeat protein [Pectobacterium carotovorum]
MYDGRGLLIKETAPNDTLHHRYDAAGRLIRKKVVQPGYRPQVWHYRWDSRNQLRVVDTPMGECWFVSIPISLKILMYLE